MKTRLKRSTRRDALPHPPSVLSEPPPTTRSMLRNIAVMVSTAALLLPIVLSAGWTLERNRQQLFQRMREDHVRRVEAARRLAQERRRLREMEGKVGPGTPFWRSPKSEK
jgi:hypothetical protein